MPQDRPVEISIIVPCRNEAETVLELAERVGRLFATRDIAGELVLVDDGSTDHTGTLIDGLVARLPFVQAVHHQHSRGIAEAWASGVERARGRLVVVMDADLEYLPEDINRLHRHLKYSNADLVQGWRSHIARVRDGRYLVSRALDNLLRLLFRPGLYDIKSGFFICEREVLAQLLKRRAPYYHFQTLIMVAARHAGYRVEQIETLYVDRKLGRSYLSTLPLGVILRTLYDVARGFVDFRLRSARTDVLGEFLSQHPPARAADEIPPLRRAYLRLFALLMPFHHWIVSSPALRYYYQLRRTQWLRPEDIRTLQEQRLRSLVRYAYRHVAFYREAFDRLGIGPDDIAGIDDLARLPVLTKDEIRRNLYFDLISDAHDKRQMLPISTSGSTGEPLTIYADKTQLEMRWATTLRNIEWTGYRFGDRQVRLWHSTIGMSRIQVFKERLDALLTRRKFFPVFEMNQATILRYVDFVRRKRPALIDGYAEAFHLIANFIKQNDVSGIQPKGIISSAQTLSPESRTTIERAFRAKVFDKYGSREFSGIAHECEVHDGYHVNAESYIVEIVRDGKPVRPGEVGEVVVTDLTNRSVPLIRYAVGDLVTAVDGPCPCGRGLPRIGTVQGRVQSIIIGTNGCYLPGAFFPHLLKDYGHIIRQFQVVQEELGAIEFYVVEGPRFSLPALDEILAMFRRHLGDDMVINVHSVERIALVRTGKHRDSVSKLAITPDVFARYRLAGEEPPAEH